MQSYFPRISGEKKDSLDLKEIKKAKEKLTQCIAEFDEIDQKMTL